ncbi:MAG: helix-turn-helix domain-containing protein [Ruminococcaceae bacterium]|nr:helix-turn-helix domain-containing protein [Oscillospiraceae bacterium]
MTSDFDDYYHHRFAGYDDVVGVEEMCAMLGGISRKSCYKLLHSKAVGNFKLGKDYKIPKINIISYLQRVVNA